MDDNDFYPYAYQAIGMRYYEAHPGYRQKRVSMIGGLCEGIFQAPFMFEGHCNAGVFELYVERVLLPALSKGMTIIIDNASFHRSEKVRDMIESAGCQLMYLPPYSPDLNPIEHWRHKIKNASSVQDLTTSHGSDFKRNMYSLMSRPMGLLTN